MGSTRSRSRSLARQLSKAQKRFFSLHKPSKKLYGGWKWSKKVKSKSRTRHRAAWRKETKKGTKRANRKKRKNTRRKTRTRKR